MQAIQRGEGRVDGEKERRVDDNGLDSGQGVGNDPANKSASQNCTEYIWTNTTSWTFPEDGDAGRTIEPIPYTGESEEFAVKQ